MNFGGVNMAPLEDAFVLPFREKPSARKEIENLKQRVLELENTVIHLVNEINELKELKEHREHKDDEYLRSEPSNITKVMSSVKTFIGHIPFFGNFVKSKTPSVDEQSVDLIVNPLDVTNVSVEQRSSEKTVAIDDETTRTNKFQAYVTQQEYDACIAHREREDKAIRDSFPPSREDAQKAFDKFNDDRNDEAFKIYSNYISNRGY